MNTVPMMKESFEKALLRKHIVFSGLVQGVGFRYRAVRAAELYGCTGWVRNDLSGSVTMEIQGTEEQIGLVIRAIERGRFIRIESISSQIIPAVLEERSFREEWD